MRPTVVTMATATATVREWHPSHMAPLGVARGLTRV